MSVKFDWVAVRAVSAGVHDLCVPSFMCFCYICILSYLGIFIFAFPFSFRIFFIFLCLFLLFLFFYFLLLVTLVTDPSAPPGTVLNPLFRYNNVYLLHVNRCDVLFSTFLKWGNSVRRVIHGIN